MFGLAPRREPSAPPDMRPQSIEPRVSAGAAWNLRVPSSRGPESVGSSGGPRVSVVQAANLRKRDHLSVGRMLDSTRGE